MTALAHAYPALAAMEKHGVVLSVHGEVTDPDIDVFDRERVFIERSLARIVRDFPALKIVLEHITTREAAQFVRAAPATVAATITPQHLLYSRNALFVGGVRPHLYCLPILKRETHRQALVDAAISGRPEILSRHRFGAASRDTPRRPPAAAPAAIRRRRRSSSTRRSSRRPGRSTGSKAFASRFGAAFYGLPPHADTVTLVREPWTVPAEYPLGEHTIVPLRAGESVRWKIGVEPRRRSSRGLRVLC